MAKKAKIKATPHIVILDTNILWDVDPANLVNPEFESFWNTFSNNTKINLYIPEVVKGELLYQINRSAINSIDKINSSMDNIYRVSGKRYRHKITNEDIKVLTEKRFDKWLSAKKGKIVSTPIGKIDWNEIVRMAVWRVPPFEERNSKKDIEEKGFRDSMILETVVDICRHENKTCDISFICNDGVLRDATNERLKNDKRFDCYESIDNFQSYLKLVKEELKVKFIRVILAKTLNKFFKVGDGDSYFYSKKIKNLIMLKYRTYFEDPLLSKDKGGLLSRLKTGESPAHSTDPAPGTIAMPGGIPGQGGYTYTSEAVGVSNTTDRWKPIDDGCMYVSSPEFVKQEENYYYWKSKITYRMLYRNAISIFDNNLLLVFSVAWKVKVASDGKFLDFQLIGIDMIENQFKTADD